MKRNSGKLYCNQTGSTVPVKTCQNKVAFVGKLAQKITIKEIEWIFF